MKSFLPNHEKAEVLVAQQGAGPNLSYISFSNTAQACRYRHLFIPDFASSSYDNSAPLGSHPNASYYALTKFTSLRTELVATFVPCFLLVSSPPPRSLTTDVAILLATKLSWCVLFILNHGCEWGMSRVLPRTPASQGQVSYL